MIERVFWEQFVAPALHQPGAGLVAWKVPAALRKGIPDVWCAGPGYAGWLELKYLEAWPVRGGPAITGLTPAQAAHLREARRAKQLGALLLGVDDEWFLLEKPPFCISEAEALGSERGAIGDYSRLRKALGRMNLSRGGLLT